MPPTATPPAPAALVWLDPQGLLNRPGNIRADLGDLGELTASIKAAGVLQPLVVIPDGDGHRILAGKRRATAAVAAQVHLVPCWERPDLNHLSVQVAAQLVENEHRKALTVAERARGYQQLALEGLSAAKIARATGTKPAAVKKALTIGASDVATAAAERYDLTLDQALGLAEFQDDTEALKRLVAAAKTSPGNWDHVLSRLQADRADAKARKEVTDALTAQGLTVIDGEAPDGAIELTRLADADNQRLTTQTHAHCPGHAVALSAWDPHRSVEYCLDPAAHGHHDLWANRNGTARGPARGPDGKLSEAARQQRRNVIGNNKQWRAAEPVRRQYVKALIARKTPPKDTLRYVTQVVLGRPGRLNDGRDDLLAELLGVTAPDNNHNGETIEHAYGRHVGPAALADTADSRLPLLLLAQVAAAHEATMNVDTWRSTQPAAASWLQYLAGTGYTLSAVERLVIDTATGKTPPQPGDTDGDN